jgi:hypothetical protein
VPRQPCPYEGCGCRKVWYWGWYKRKAGSVPFDDGESASGPIPLRRFRCTKCRRTFSWRPPLLIFGRRFAAVVYQQALKEWALRGSRRFSGGEGWHEPGPASRKAFFRRLDELLGGLGTAMAAARQRLWQRLRRLARTQSRVHGVPRLAVHCLAILWARHPHGTRYLPQAC